MGLKAQELEKPKEQTAKCYHRGDNSGEQWDWNWDMEPNTARHRTTGRTFTFLPCLVCFDVQTEYWDDSQFPVLVKKRTENSKQLIRVPHESRQFNGY